MGQSLAALSLSLSYYDGTRQDMCIIQYTSVCISVLLWCFILISDQCGCTFFLHLNKPISQSVSHTLSAVVVLFFFYHLICHIFVNLPVLSSFFLWHVIVNH